MILPAEQWRKVHHVSVCIVPPTEVWENITRCRRELLDPGFYRWPPHINLLYPFFDFAIDDTQDSASGNLSEIIASLEEVCRQCDPFDVQLAHFGTFGGQQRGVLWLDPTVMVVGATDTPTDPGTTNPEDEDTVVYLQCRLAGASFTVPDDELEASNTGQSSFRPHMTVGHFATIDAARQTQSNVDEWWCPVSFPVDRIHLLHRRGADGQFLRVADIPLGGDDTRATQLHMPPVMFPGMPTQEDQWVTNARQELRNNRKKGRPRRRKS